MQTTRLKYIYDFFFEIILVIEEEWFCEINLTDSDTFLPTLIKREESISNQEKST